MATTATASAAPGTPDKPSRSPSPVSPQFKLRPADTVEAAHPSEPATEEPVEGNAPAPVPTNDAEESLMFMLNAVQQIAQQNQQNQANATALAQAESTEDQADDPPQGTPPPMQDLQLDPALMAPGAPGAQPAVPPQQQHLPGQPPPHPHQMHHPHMHHQAAMMYHHPPPQYIASPYPPPAGHTMPPPPELQQIPQPAVRATRSGRAGTAPSGDSQYEDDGDEGDSSFVDTNGQVPSGPSAEPAAQPAAPGGNKKGKWATSDTVDWQRKRKDNHKEVERRRRSNINDGINELARMVPNVGAEKAKGAILSRSVQYIHDLKENEARNIEKWTLEKLLMDQAMGDLQAQLDEMRQRLEEERQRREQAEAQLAETLRMQQERAIHEEPGAKRARVE